MKTCTACGFTCSDDDAPTYFNKRYGRARGVLESHCKACRNQERADREARKRNDPAHIAAKSEKNRAAYLRRRDTLLAQQAERRAAKRAAQPKAEPKARAARKPTKRTVTRVSIALGYLDRALIAMNPEDETLRKFHRVVRAVSARVIEAELEA